MMDGFSGQFFFSSIFEINLFCFDVAICDLVHDVKAIYMASMLTAITDAASS